MEEPISFWGYKEQETNLILPEHDDDDDENLSGYYMYQIINSQQFYVLPTVYFCFSCWFENKQWLFPYTTLTDWFFINDI